MCYIENGIAVIYLRKRVNDNFDILRMNKLYKKKVYQIYNHMKESNGG